MEKQKIPLEFITVANEALLALKENNLTDKSFGCLAKDFLIPAFLGRRQEKYYLDNLSLDSSQKHSYFLRIAEEMGMPTQKTDDLLKEFILFIEYAPRYQEYLKRVMPSYRAEIIGELEKFLRILRKETLADHAQPMEKVDFLEF